MATTPNQNALLWYDSCVTASINVRCLSFLACWIFVIKFHCELTWLKTKWKGILLCYNNNWVCHTFLLCYFLLCYPNKLENNGKRFLSAFNWCTINWVCDKYIPVKENTKLQTAMPQVPTSLFNYFSTHRNDQPQVPTTLFNYFSTHRNDQDTPMNQDIPISQGAPMSVDDGSTRKEVYFQILLLSSFWLMLFLEWA